MRSALKFFAKPLAQTANATTAVSQRLHVLPKAHFGLLSTFMSKFASANGMKSHSVQTQISTSSLASASTSSQSALASTTLNALTSSTSAPVAAFATSNASHQSSGPAVSLSSPQYAKLNKEIVLYEGGTSKFYRSFGKGTAVLCTGATGMMIFMSTHPAFALLQELGIIIPVACGSYFLVIALGAWHFLTRAVGQIKLLPQNRVEITTIGYVSKGVTRVHHVDSIIPGFSLSCTTDRPFQRMKVLKNPGDPKTELLTYYVMTGKNLAPEPMHPLFENFMLSNTLKSDPKSTVIDMKTMKR